MDDVLQGATMPSMSNNETEKSLEIKKLLVNTLGSGVALA